MAERDLIPWRLRPGPYLGEISALSFLHLPPHISSFPLLVAGSGSELLVYDVKSGNLLNSFHVFQGIRVHGISLQSTDSKALSNSPIVDFLIAVFGERRVKMFVLRFDEESCGRSGDRAVIRMELVHQLPRFDHWVLDACFLKEDDHLAVGLSDNSVALWDISRFSVVRRVKSTERCLLYTMRMWGNSIEALRVASGTIYNEIIIWRLSPQDNLPSSAFLMESIHQRTSGHKDIQLHGQQYMATHLSRLTGHEGSIFRIAWSSDGSRLMSVSDDRSARIWIISGQRQACGNSGEILGCHLSVNLVLFGHNARIWDCYISDSIVITAGEDCTCRVWGMDGKQLLTIKEHLGRGIWRCLYDPSSSVLITAGFDSAIKVHVLHSSSLKEMAEHNVVLNELKNQTEIFTVSAPKVSKQLGLMDSKSEYVRCLRFTRENILYVATNNGYLHRVELCNPGDVRWTELAQVSEEAPIICMDLISIKSSELSLVAEDIIAVGDGKGNVTVVRLVNDDPVPKLALSFTWSAEKERQLLGIYWCKSLGCCHLFTADPKGILKLWKIGDALQSGADNTNIHPEVSLVAEFTSCFGARIICLDASIEEEVLVCGDQRGNLTVYPFSKGLIVANSIKTVEKVPLLNQFKGAHGISSVTSILIATVYFNQIEIRTTGGDGCICYFKYNKNVQILEFIGMKQVKELSTIQSVPTNSSSEDNLAPGNYAIGFTSADFIMWNLTNDSKTVQIPCGGWRRSHSYYLGAVPEYQNCFAYLKDHNIHIHKLWVPAQERQLIPKVLHMQYHGREIHSLCFISFGLQSNPVKSCYSWIATGCEDGSVRLTRYTSFDMGSWCESKLLGEHVGGSAVRSIYFVSKLYTITASQTCSFKGRNIHHALLDSEDDQFLLISVGAKQVLTSWLLRYRTPDIEELHLKGSVADSEHMFGPPTTELSSISFQWLSTHMPPKFASNHWKVNNLLEITERGNSSTIESALPESCLAECGKQKAKPALVDLNENDWRYMAVTAFLVKHADSRITVCFIVVACSDATLTLRALLLPFRLWYDIATLVPQTSPVLALQHIVIPGFAQTKDNVQTGNAYIIISGSTDGCITFWDLTETVECFTQLILELQPQMLIDCQRRPQTGRGSQGGRLWRSLINQSSGKSVGDSLSKIEGGNNTNGQSTLKILSDCSSTGGSDSVNNQTSCSQTSSKGGSDSVNNQTSCSQTSSNISSSEIREIRPLHVLNSVHQSGVNCLHVSEMKDCLLSESEMAYCVLSGGDDQAVHYLAFDLTLQIIKPDSCSSQPTCITNHVQDGTLDQPPGSSFMRKCSYQSLNHKYQLRILNQDRIDSAHSSAVKGIWTDGIWAFSTGLDQRIRCWKIDHSGKLSELAHLIISVPEPEALDAIISDSSRKRYQITVAGRGMQMVEFYASIDED